MPEIPVVQFNHDDQYPPEEDAGLSDFLFAPRVPEKVIEQEKTPEQLRLEHFHGEGLTYRENYGNDNAMRYALAMDDVCRYENMTLPDGRKGPRVHTVIGRNCPHGMLETLEMQRGE